MRRLLLGLFASLGLLGVAGEARAQSAFTGINDPFFLYYGFYLPRQQAQALQSGPEATINAISAARQSYAATNRSDMFDPNGQGFNRFEQDADFLAGSGGRNRGPAGTGAQVARHGGNLAGHGVPARYNRYGNWHPTVRSGQSRNANVAVTRSHGSMGGFGGFNSGVGLPGPR